MWTTECQTAFKNLNRQVANVVGLRHFEVHRDLRIVCDTSHNGLGAVFEQLGPEGWRPISIAPRYRKEAEKKYSTNEFEKLAVVWELEYFGNYILGQKFYVITDYEALVFLLNGNNKKNKTKFGRVTRWSDRLILFDFLVERKPAVKIGLADYLSRYPNGDAVPVNKYDNVFRVAKLGSICRAMGDDQLNSTTGPVITSSKAKLSNKMNYESIHPRTCRRGPEDVISCGCKSTNHSQEIYTNQRLSKTEANLVEATIHSKSCCLKLRVEYRKNGNKFHELRTILKRHLNLHRNDDEIEGIITTSHLDVIRKNHIR